MSQSPARTEGGREPRLRLTVELRNPVRAPIDRVLLRRVARRVLEAEGFKEPLEIAIHIVDDSRIRVVNQEQRGIDRPTDVLSFPLLDTLQLGEKGFALPPGTPRHLGEVLISYERARGQAVEYGHTVEREVCYLLAHGVLHMLGYDHLRESERQVMRQREEAALGPLGLSRS